MTSSPEWSSESSSASVVVRVVARVVIGVIAGVGVLKWGYLSTPNLCTGSCSTPRQGWPGERQESPRPFLGRAKTKHSRQGPGKRSLPGQEDKAPGKRSLPGQEDKAPGKRSLPGQGGKA